MFLAGELAVAGVKMSFSRRIGASPSMKNRMRASLFVMTDLPITIRSPGFNSTFNAIAHRLRSPRHGHAGALGRHPFRSS